MTWLQRWIHRLVIWMRPAPIVPTELGNTLADLLEGQRRLHERLERFEALLTMTIANPPKGERLVNPWGETPSRIVADCGHEATSWFRPKDGITRCPDCYNRLTS